MDSEITAVAALADTSRRRIYEFVRHAAVPVTREQAAVAVGISSKLAAFHLDKLVGAGLLLARSESTGRVGRRPKVYEPTEETIALSIPERRHDLLAEILAEAVSDADGCAEAVADIAHRKGREVGEEERVRTRPGRLGVERALTLAEGILDRLGFEPQREASNLVRLRNCPFQPFSARMPDLVCMINHAFVGGLLAGLEARAATAVLVPRPGVCCVELRGAGSH